MTGNDSDAALAGDSPDTLLAEMTSLRRRARIARQAYWFPLVIFGVIETASAPLYYVRRCHAVGNDLCTDSSPGSVMVHVGQRIFVLNRDTYGLLATIAGIGLTLWWYRRHARRVGLRTGTRGPLLAWTGASLGIIALTFVPILWSTFWVLGIRFTAWLLAVAVGLLALACAERSRLLGTVAVAHAAAAAVGTVYDPENELYWVLHRFGVASDAMPIAFGGTVNVLLPGMVLLVGAVAALAVNRRRPA